MGAAYGVSKCAGADGVRKMCNEERRETRCAGRMNVVFRSREVLILQKFLGIEQ